MKNVLFGYPNRIDEATLSGGAWLAGLPLANVQTRVLAKVARSTDLLLASTQMAIDLGRPRMIGVVSLVAHNLSTAAKVRVVGDDAADFATPLVDSGWVQVWPWGMIPDALLEWEDDNFWMGCLSEEARAGYQAHYICTLPRTAARYWRIEIDDTGNGDGYVHVGRVVIADSWQPAMNFSFGNGLGLTDRSASSESLGGTEYFDSRAMYRVTSLTLNWLTSDEAYARLLEMQRLLGVTGELLLVPDSDDVTNMPRRAYLGRLLDLSPLDHPHLNKYRTSLKIKELL